MMGGITAEKEGSAKRDEKFYVSLESALKLIQKRKDEELAPILKMNPSEELETRARVALKKFESRVMEIADPTNPVTKEEMKRIQREAAKHLLELRAIREIVMEDAKKKEAERQAARQAQEAGLKAGAAQKLHEKWKDGSLTFESKDLKTVSSVMDAEKKWRVLFNEDGTITIRNEMGEIQLRGNDVVTKLRAIKIDDAVRIRDEALKILTARGLEPAGAEVQEWGESDWHEPSETR